jgi:hypothetical protein
MHVAAHRAIRHRDKGLADEHVPQADSEKKAIAIKALSAKSTKVKRVCCKRIGKDRHRLVNLGRRISLNLNHPSLSTGYNFLPDLAIGRFHRALGFVPVALSPKPRYKIGQIH